MLGVRPGKLLDWVCVWEGEDVSRLRNRMVKATFWTDPELLRWTQPKRAMYLGIWAMAEDSGCLEDDPFEWKCVLFPSPIDVEFTVERLTTWRDELTVAGKLIPYESDGKSYLFIRNFHQHEHPRNPQPADLPLPPWVTWEKHASAAGKSYHRYTVLLGTTTVPPQNGDGTTTEPPPLSCPVLSGSVQSRPKTGTDRTDIGETLPQPPPDAPASPAWGQAGASPEQLKQVRKAREKIAALAATMEVPDG